MFKVFTLDYRNVDSQEIDFDCWDSGMPPVRDRFDIEGAVCLDEDYDIHAEPPKFQLVAAFHIADDETLMQLLARFRETPIKGFVLEDVGFEEPGPHWTPELGKRLAAHQAREASLAPAL